MIFGSIEYLNLLPFQLFLKQHLKSSQEKQIIRYRRFVPSTVNKLFLARRVDAAFISSIKSKNRRCSDIGIVADGAVYSVLLLKSEQMFDSESDTSNILSKVLSLRGEVIIGDKALKRYIEGVDAIDLALKWKEETRLPFVFARLCYNCYEKRILKLAKEFIQKRQKIPTYYLNRAAKQKSIEPKVLKWYLKHISYKIGHKEKRALKLFLKKAAKVDKQLRDHCAVVS